MSDVKPYKCKFCDNPVSETVIDLGHQPPSNNYIRVENKDLPETFYPLEVYVCTQCWHVQIPDHASAETHFSEDYAYFSSTSKSWLIHSKKYVEDVISRLKLDKSSYVVELASNDGYLLQYFKEVSIPCFGIEPTTAAANESRKKGITTIEEFFGLETARILKANHSLVDLVIGNNVLAHVPDINDFFSGVPEILKDEGVATFEFPHLLNLISLNQFDTIYHEHYSYLSLGFVTKLAVKHGMRVFDVEKLSTHGGSLRAWLCKMNASHAIQNSVESMLTEEKQAGLETLEVFKDFQNKALDAKLKMLNFLINCKLKNEKVCAYGAAAKGNTFLNYSGISSDLLPFVVDKAKSKQGKLMPGSRIPIVSIEDMRKFSPNHIIILPWNLIDEISNQLKSDGITAQCHTFIPTHVTRGQ